MQDSASNSEDSPAYARRLSEQGEIALHAGDAERALARFQEAVAHWRALDDATSLAQALHNLAVTYARQGHFTDAVPLLEEAIGLLVEVGNRADEATSRNALGNVYADLGEFPRAIELLTTALPLRREAGHWPGLALTLGCLARIHDQVGDRLQALEYRRQAYAAIRMAHDPAAEAEALLELARAGAAVGYLAEALGHFEQVATLYARIGDTKRQGAALLAQAEARFEAGDHQGSVAVAEQAFPLIRGTDAWTEMATQLEQLAHTLRFTTQALGMLQSWKRGSAPNVEGLRAVVEQHGEKEPDDSPIHQLLDGLSGALDHLGSLSPPTPVAPQPTGDEQAAADTRSVDELLAALKHPEQRERRIAALTLSLRGDRRAVEPLIAATRDRSQWVRLAAVRALGKLRDVRALDALAERLRGDRDKEVRRSAATALRLLKDRRAIDALTAGLTDDSWRVVEAAEKALRALKAAPRVAILIDTLRTGSSQQRCYAAIRLGTLSDQAAVAPLLDVAENIQEVDWLRIQALDAAAKLGATRAADVALQILQAQDAGRQLGGMTAGPEAELACKAAEVIAQVGDARTIPALLPLLDDGNPYVRYAAIQGLGVVGDAAAIPPLEALQQRDPASVQIDMSGMQHVRLRNAAAEAIAAIRTREAHRMKLV